MEFIRGLQIGFCLSVFCSLSFLLLWNFYQSVQHYSFLVTNDGESINDPKIILSWTNGDTSKRKISYFHLHNCDHQRCKLSYDKHDYNNAAAVLFHVGELTRHGKLLVNLPKYRNKGQYFIFETKESPRNVPRRGTFVPEIKTNFFNWTMTYRTDSDIFSPYGYQKSFEPPRSEELTNIRKMIVQYVGNKLSPLVWFVGDCQANNKREILVSELSKYIDIDIIGKCHPDKNERFKQLFGALENQNSDCVDKHSGCEAKLLNEKYWFYIALENSDCRDYITEKYFLRQQFYSIPIVMRRKIYTPHVPPQSFIAVDDFSSVEQLAVHLHYLMINKTAYMDYLNWRTIGYKRHLEHSHEKVYCTLCKKLWSTPEKKTYYDIENWWIGNGGCDSNFVEQFLNRSRALK